MPSPRSSARWTRWLAAGRMASALHRECRERMTQMASPPGPRCRAKQALFGVPVAFTSTDPRGAHRCRRSFPRRPRTRRPAGAYLRGGVCQCHCVGPSGAASAAQAPPLLLRRRPRVEARLALVQLRGPASTGAVRVVPSSRSHKLCFCTASSSLITSHSEEGLGRVIKGGERYRKDDSQLLIYTVILLVVYHEGRSEGEENLFDSVGRRLDDGATERARSV